MLTHGWDNVAVILDNKIVFRFPKDRQNPQFKIELEINPELVKRVSLPVPHFTYIAKDTSFAGYPMIQGSSLTPRQFSKLSQTHKDVIAEQLARFLTELHTFPLAIAKKCGVHPSWSTTEARKWYGQQLVVLKKKMREKDYKVLIDILNRYDQDYTFKPALAHQDLTYDNMVISKQKTVAGVIDFGDIQIADPARDIGCLAEYGIEFFDAVLKYYKPRDKHFRDRALRGYALLSLSFLYNGVTKKMKESWRRGYALLKARRAGLI